MKQNLAPYPLTQSPQEVEQHRHECEARHWLRVTGGSVSKVDELMDRIAKKRSTNAADKLRSEMRRQYVLQQKNSKGDM